MRRFQHVAAVLLIALVTLVAYAGARDNGFVWDDNYQIVRNPTLHPDQPWSMLFTADVWAYTRGGAAGTSNYYRPLPMLVYRMVAESAGVDPAAYHAVSLAMNILAACAAYWLALLLLQGRAAVALAAALLFAAHPIHSEAVFWIAGLADLGCALFYFLAFALYLLAWREPLAAAPARKKRKQDAAPNAPRRVPVLVLSAAMFVVAVFWKEMALSFAPLVAVHGFIAAAPDASWRERLRRAGLRSAPYWAATLVYLAVRVAVLGRFSAVQHDWPLSALAYILTAIDLVANYWLKLIAPLQLNAYHVFRPVRTIADLRALVSLIFLIAAIAAILRGMRRWALATFAAAWVFITLIPVLNLRGVGQNVFAERYLYLPSLGFCVLVAWLVAEALRRVPPKFAFPIAATAVAIVVIACVIEVRARAADWQDDFALLTATVRSSPRSAVMHNGLGHVLSEQKHDYDAAQAQYELAYQEASRESPPDKEQMANALVGLGGVYYWRHDFARSLQYIDQAISLDPSFGSARVAKGMDLLALNRLDEAQRVFAGAHQVYPNDEVVLNGLGMVALARHDTAAAIHWLSEAVRVVPTNVDGYTNLGRALVEAGQINDAIGAFRRAAELAPDSALTHAFLADALARAGQYDSARSEFTRALSIDPSLLWARQGLQALDQAEAQRNAAPR